MRGRCESAAGCRTHLCHEHHCEPAAHRLLLELLVLLRLDLQLQFVPGESLSRYMFLEANRTSGAQSLNPVRQGVIEY